MDNTSMELIQKIFSTKSQILTLSRVMKNNVDDKYLIAKRSLKELNTMANEYLGYKIDERINKLLTSAKTFANNIQSNNRLYFKHDLIKELNKFMDFICISCDHQNIEVVNIK